MTTKFEVLISKERIQGRVKEIGSEINRQYSERVSEISPLLVVGVLKGAFVFLADLVRELKIPCEIEFVSASSYGDSTESSGNVKFQNFISRDLKGREVLIVEDIVDTGLTMKKMLGEISNQGAEQVAVCSLLYKPSRKQVDIPIEFLGFEIDDKFVIGYGLDFDDRYRDLEEIVIYSPESEG